ncbi:MAG: hypothetical protein KAS66_05285 [Candidatus Omnitrophica bacterium]|nr:hypothetical protein [Candidatus Omnitrophota bacterium]
MKKATKKAEVKEVVEEAPKSQTANVLIRTGNVWMNGAKFLQFDIVELTPEQVDFLVKRGQGMKTSDAPTVVGINEDGKPGRREI